MKFRKIFIFILLLCTIFSTLLFITPKINAQEITNLNGTWVFNDTLTLSPLWDLDITTNAFASMESTQYDGSNIDSMHITSSGIFIHTQQGLSAWPYDKGKWQLGFTPQIEIYNASEIINDKDYENFATWLNANATLVTDPIFTISGQYQFNEEITWLYDTSEQEGVLYLPFYVYNFDNSSRVNYDYILNDNRVDLFVNYFFYANDSIGGVFTGQYAGIFATPTTIRMFGDERIIYFYTANVSQDIYNWLNNNGQFINDPTLDPNNPDNPNSGNNPNNPNNPNFGTDTVRQIVNQVNAFLGIQILPGLSFRDILLICIALPLLMYILKVFLGG